jgi:hypothetical protein
MPRAGTHRGEPVVKNPRRMCRSRGGGTGRRSGLKIPWPEGRVGSIPTPGTPVSSTIYGGTAFQCAVESLLTVPATEPVAFPFGLLVVKDWDVHSERAHECG